MSFIFCSSFLLYWQKFLWLAGLSWFKLVLAGRWSPSLVFRCWCPTSSSKPSYHLACFFSFFFSQMSVTFRFRWCCIIELTVVISTKRSQFGSHTVPVTGKWWNNSLLSQLFYSGMTLNLKPLLQVPTWHCQWIVLYTQVHSITVNHLLVITSIISSLSH